MRKTTRPKPRKQSSEQARGQCVCGAVKLEFDVPAFWAWHDHSRASRHAQGCAYATYIGVWRSKLRVLEGEDEIKHYEDAKAGTTRSFCGVCGTPIMYERGKSPKMVNLPRALFTTRTGREPRYHIAIDQQVEWIYLGEKLVPLKNYPGVMWTWPKPKKGRRAPVEEPDFDIAPEWEK
jgi:hypothetical protein